MQASLFEVPRSEHLAFNLDNVGIKNYLTHNFHPYPAKFIPQIPATILDTYAAPGDVVLDPFSGSGTVAVEASLRGYRCFASDINPIANLVATAKTCRITLDDKLQLSRLLCELSRNRRKKSVTVPTFKNRELWFTEQMADELAVILDAIQRYATSASAKALARCAFSAIIVKCSNQESETHWRSISKSLERGFAIKWYSLRLSDMINRAVHYASLARAIVTVKTANALSLDYLGAESVDLVITSPPYANSHDYYLYNKLRMFWLGYDHYVVQRSEIGSRHRHSDLGQPIAVYFEEMARTLSEIVRVLKPNGKAAIVVGDSIFRAQLIDMGQEFLRLSREAGLALRFRYDYDQRRYTSAFQRGLKTLPKRSHILVFSK